VVFSIVFMYAAMAFAVLWVGFIMYLAGLGK